jgi:7-cyano-7-deazaguanine synthase
MTPVDAASDRRAVVLLSGGLDSATTLAIVRADGWSCHALTVAYGQRHSGELDCARRVAAASGAVEHRILEIDLRAFGGSSLVGAGEIPKGGLGAAGAIPSTYVPARNTVLLSVALAWAESLDAGAIALGVNAVDFSGYPDCRPEFLEAFARLAAVGTRRGVEDRPIRLLAPLLRLTKAEIIREGIRLGVDYALTSSCYDPGPGGRPCGACDACRLRRAGFAAAGFEDPLERRFRGVS